MNVLGHDHISHHYETVARSDLFQDLEKQIPATWTVKQRPTMITTGGDEVQVSTAVVTMQASGHNETLSGK